MKLLTVSFVPSIGRPIDWPLKAVEVKFSNTLSSGASKDCPISDIITPLSLSISSLGNVEFFIMSDKISTPNSVFSCSTFK